MCTMKKTHFKESYDEWEEYPFGKIPRKQPDYWKPEPWHRLYETWVEKKFPMPTYCKVEGSRHYGNVTTKQIEWDRILWYYAKRYKILWANKMSCTFKLQMADGKPVPHDGIVDGDWGSS